MCQLRIEGLGFNVSGLYFSPTDMSGASRTDTAVHATMQPHKTLTGDSVAIAPECVSTLLHDSDCKLLLSHCVSSC